LWDVSSVLQSVAPRPISPPPFLTGTMVAPLLGTDYHLVWAEPNEFGPRIFLYRGLGPPESVPGFPEIRDSGDNAIQISNHLLMLYARIHQEWYALVWDLARQRVVHLVKAASRRVHGAAFASDGSCVFLGMGGRVERLDLTTGVSDVWNDATPGMFTPVAILPDNRTVFAGGGLGVLRKLDFSTRHWEEVIGSSSFIECLCVSPTGTRLATGDRSGIVRLWDVQTLREVAEFGTHPGPVTGLWFTPDGRSLLSVDATELRVWRTSER